MATISWLYTCQLGSDIGVDYSSKSPKIAGVTFTDGNRLSTDDADDSKTYKYEVAEDIQELAFAVQLDNYASRLSVKVDGETVKYRPNETIPVKKNSSISITSTLEYMDAANNNEVTVYTDEVILQLVQQNSVPTVSENAPTVMETAVNEKITADFSTFFTDADGDTLTYRVSCAALNLDQEINGGTFEGEIPAAGEYSFVITATDPSGASATHTVSVKVSAAAENHAPTIKAAYAETNSRDYTYVSSYQYIYMHEIFEDADGDALTYEATLDGERVEISYNSWSKEHYIIFNQKNDYKEYKITASDGKATSEVFTARCLGVAGQITWPQDTPLININAYNDNTRNYVKGMVEDDTFEVEYTLSPEQADPAKVTWTTNNNILTSNGDGTFNVGEVTSRTQVQINPQYDGQTVTTMYVNLLPGYPAVSDITVGLAEHADQQKTTTIKSPIQNGWYVSDFTYEVEDESICSVVTSGSYDLAVTPKKLGTTKITAVSKYDDKLNVTFNITVTGKQLQMKDQPDLDDVYLEEGKTTNVQMEVLGKADDETFTWTSSNEDIATVDENGLVTVKGSGTCTILCSQ